MGTPVRYPNGVTNNTPTSPTAMLPVLDPSNVQMYFNDFHVYTAGDWTETAVSVGTGTSASAISDAAGGVVTLTSAANENDGAWYESQGESWTVEAGKKMWIKVRFKTSDATQSDIIFGLHSTSTTPQSAANRFLFESVDGSAAVYFNSDDNTNDEDSDTVATLADATWITLAAYWDGVDTVELFADGVKVTSFTPTTTPTTELALGWGQLNGSASVETLDVDYILVAKER